MAICPPSLSKYLGLEVNYVFPLGLSREVHSTLRKVAGGLVMRKKIGWSRLALGHFLISTCFPKCHPWCSRTFFLTKHFRGKWEMTVGVCYYLIDVSDCVLAKKTPKLIIQKKLFGNVTLFKGIWRRSDYYFQDSSLYLIQFSWKFLDKPVIPIPYKYVI